MAARKPSCRELTASLALAALATVAAGCGDRRTADADLGSLVLEKTDEVKPVDVKAAGTNVGEFRRALAIPHTRIAATLGAHKVVGSSSVKVTAEGQVVTDLSDKTSIVIDAEGNYMATADNSRDYGRHAIYTGGELFLRPRFGKYHRRAPANTSEPGAILDEMFSTSNAYFDLLYARVELSLRGDERAGDRAARKIDFKIAPAPSDRDSETLAHKKWRESISVESAAGWVLLDLDGGFALAADIAGTITFVKEGKQFTMEVRAQHAIEDIGADVAIAAPAPSETVATPMMRTEVDEQTQLLEGLERVRPSGDAKK